jgi:hypothetical protein
MPKELVQNILKFSEFSAGLGDSKFRGSRGSYAKAVGIDIHSEPGIIKAQQALAKDSGTTVVDLILVSVHTSAGHSYHFGNAGKIYKRTSGGSWSVLQTVTATPAILGAAEHSDGYVYFTYSNKVGRIKVSDDSYTENWNTLTNTNTNYGPVVYNANLDKIFIGNQELVASISSASAFTAGALDLKAGYEIRGITGYDINVLIGATDKGNNNYSIIVDWDGVSSSWQYMYSLGESILWMINKQEKIYIGTDNQGKIYDFPELEDPIKQIPGDYSSTATLTCKPYGKAVYNGFLHIGYYDKSTGNPFPNGIYTLGTKSKDDLPLALNSAEYVISQNKTTQITIGAVSTDGNNLFVAWQDSTTYGVDKIDFSNKYSSAFIEFLVADVRRETQKSFDQFPCSFKPMSANCSLALKYKLDHSASWTTLATVNTQDKINDDGSFSETADGYLIQTRLDFGVSGDNSPEVEELGIVFTPQDFV